MSEPRDYNKEDSHVEDWDDERDADATRTSNIISDREHYSDEDAEKARQEYLDKYYGK